MSTTVLIADDYPVVRCGIRALLSSVEGYKVIGEASNGREAVQQAARLHPDVVLIDPAMPELNGADATARIRRETPGTIVLALSMHADRTHVRRMLASGVSGYVLKTCDVDELFRAIDVARSGGTYLSPEVAGTVVEDYVNGKAPDGHTDDRLSDREREVLQLLSEGKTTKQIGQLLHVSSRTIDSHRQRIMEKLGVKSIAELTKCAIRMGLTTLGN